MPQIKSKMYVSSVVRIFSPNKEYEEDILMKKLVHEKRMLDGYEEESSLSKKKFEKGAEFK